MSLHIFGDESGQVGGRHFLIGLLYVSSHKRADYERELQQLKLANGFSHKELHYNELNRFKTPCAKAFVNWYFGSPHAEFRCTVVPGGVFDHTRFRGNMQFMSAEEMSYNVIYKSTINHHLKPDEKTKPKVLLLDRKDKARPDEFQRFLTKNIPNVVDFQEVRSENHNLLQMVDLLTGCVNGDLNGVQSFHKRTVVDHIKARLRIADFNERNAFTNAKFRVSFWRGSAKSSVAQRQPSGPI